MELAKSPAASMPRAKAASARSAAIRFAIGEVAAARTAAAATSAITEAPDFAPDFCCGLPGGSSDLVFFGGFFAGIDFAAARPCADFPLAQPPTCLPGFAVLPA